MEKPCSGFGLAGASNDIKEKYNNLPGNDLINTRLSSLSPPASADDFGCSTAEGSVFTFNSVTDESSDEKKSEPPSPLAMNEDVRTSVSNGSKDSSTMMDGVSCQDKKNFIKIILNKEYNHVVRYDIQTLLVKMKEIQDLEEVGVKDLETKENEENEKPKKKLDSASTFEGTSPGASPTPGHNEMIKEKFSSRVFKNLFSAITSPIAERRMERRRSHKKSKSTSSPSLER